MQRANETPRGVRHVLRCPMRTATLAACAAGIVATGVASASQEDLSLEPPRAQPAQSVRIVGLAEGPEQPSITGRFAGLEGEDGEPFPLLSRRTRTGEVTFLVPLPPGEKSATLVVQIEDLDPKPDPMELAILPLDPARGATMALTELAEETLAIEAERAGVSPKELDTRLQQAPETIPVHLLPTALSRAFTAQARNRLRDFLAQEPAGDVAPDPAQLDALIAARGFVDMLRERRDRAESQPPAPLESTASQTTGNQAGLLEWIASPARAVTEPWEKLDIDTASELHYWMQRRLEYIERTPPDSRERKTLPEEIRKDVADTAKDSAKEFAEGYFAEEKKQLTESVEESTGRLLGDVDKFKRYKKAYGKIMGAAGLAQDVIDTTIYFNDRMRIALLPSTLVKLDLQLRPPVFTEEDDIRGTPGHRQFGTIDAQLEAMSDQFEFTLSDAARLASLGFTAADQAAPAPAPGDSQSSNASLAPDAKDAYKLLQRIAEKTDLIREEARSRRNEELSELGNLWIVEPFRWRVHQVEEPKYSVLTLVPSGKAAVDVFPFPTQHNPVRWGYRPLNASSSTLRLRTAADKFPGALPVATQAAVEVKAIDVQVTPGDLDMRPNQSEVFQCALSHVDEEDREWRANKGKLEEQCQRDSTCPTAKWTAPALDPDQCKDKAVLSCEAVTTQGIRADLDPPRTGTTTIRVRRPGPLVILPEASRVNAGEPVELKAEDSGQPVQWRLLEGSGTLERTGPYTARFVAETATRAQVEAFVPGEDASCRPTAWIDVVSCRSKRQGDFDGTMNGGQAKTFSREHTDNFAKLFVGGTGQPPGLQIETKRNREWKFGIGLVLAGKPVAAGSTYQVTDPGPTGIIEKEISGGFHDRRGYPENDTKDNWDEGSATVHIDQIEWADVPERTGRKGWACGTLQAQVNALRTRPSPPPIVRTGYTVQLNFTAEITRRAGTDWQPPVNKEDDSDKD